MGRAGAMVNASMTKGGRVWWVEKGRKGAGVLCEERESSTEALSERRRRTKFVADPQGGAPLFMRSATGAGNCRGLSFGSLDRMPDSQVPGMRRSRHAGDPFCAKHNHTLPNGYVR